MTDPNLPGPDKHPDQEAPSEALTSPAPQPSPAPPAQPPIFYAPPPPPPAGGNFKKGFGLGAGLSLGLALGGLVLSIVGGILSMLMLGALIAAAQGASPSTAIERTETVWGPDTATPENTVRAISISGAIMGEASNSGLGLSSGTSGYEVAAILDSLTPEKGKGVVLLMNTPGGTINGSRAIGDAINRYEQRTGQKVIAYVRGLSASGGMYSMASATEIIADHGTLIGSIGVIFGPFTRYKDVVATGSTLLEAGVTTTGGITHEHLTAGKGKDFGSPYRDMTEEERKVFTNGLNIEYDSFVNWVSQERKIPADTIRNELGAYIFDAKTAQEKGLVDKVMGPDEAFRHIATSMGIEPDKMRVIQPAAPSAWQTLLGAETRVFGQINAAAPGAKVTSVLCAETPQPLVFHGSFKSICG
ncbi:MAG: S49 family peptidase [Propionibacteriaceae bacterium]|nr:S49 family peptidase [Propionibacteriaceae bacterium]